VIYGDQLHRLAVVELEQLLVSTREGLRDRLVATVAISSAISSIRRCSNSCCSIRIPPSSSAG
jgi:hypothetical protein